MAKSLFLEGIDGTGKSSLIPLLKARLEAQGEKVLTLREPGGTPYYEAIREHIHFSNLERTALSDALTCAGGIAENIVKTKKALSQNTWVLSDRSFISNAVYQVSQGLDWATVQAVNDLALNDFAYDIKILIDIPVEVAYQRLTSIGKKKDRWETLGDAYFQTVRENYLKIAAQENMTIIDGTASLEEVKQQIFEIAGI